jgi:glycosyltransferase involved in cell wall biosynthesis
MRYNLTDENRPRIEVLLSTLNEGINGIRINKNYFYLIVHQINDDNESTYREFFNCKLKSDRVRYIQSDTVGLSKSRNIAIHNSCGDILWIMDDDTVLFDNAKSEILNQYSVSKQVVILNFVTNKYQRNNFKSHYFNLFTATKVSSINISFRRSIIDKGFTFDENFGLGTNKPSGEEYIFVTDIIRAQVPVFQSQILACVHADITSGVDFFSTKRKLQAKFYMFDRIFGRWGKLMSILFLLKKSKVIYRNKRFMKSYKHFLDYLFQGNV